MSGVRPGAASQPPTLAQPASAYGLRMVSASAGSGKTHRLTQAVIEHLSSDNAAERQRSSEEGVGLIQAPPIDGLMAVTYTRLAQAELESRLRRALNQRQQSASAAALPLAYVGTVHAVCLRLLQEFALEGGHSPAVDGLPQEAARHLLQEALEDAMDASLRRNLEEMASRLELNHDARNGRVDWITPVEQIMTLARNNRIRPERLVSMAERSWEELRQLLETPVEEGAALEHALDNEIERAIAALEALNSSQKNTARALKQLRALQAQRRGKPLTWSEWCKLTKLEPGKRARPLIEPLALAAGRYLAHPRLHADLRTACRLLFQAAQVGLTAYAKWKLERGLVDYVDMVDLALSLLDVPEVTEELEERLSFLVVDEFQDTSPIQLALFMRIHALTRRSLWVGDRKQCIFEYAGADPALMDVVTQWVREHGGETEVLGNNYRSRPELVHATSALFAAAFASGSHAIAEGATASGVVVDEVSTTPRRPAHEALAALPPLGVWYCSGPRNRELPAVADGVERLLQTPQATPVMDRVTQRHRPIRPGDIAVLVATNREAAQLAAELHRRGVTSALAQTGLMRTPEGSLLRAALGYLCDEGDALASAEILALLGFDGRSAATWLSQCIGERRREREQHPHSGSERSTERTDAEGLGPESSRAGSRRPEVPAGRVHSNGAAQQQADQKPDAANHGVLTRLDELRNAMATLSPVEMIEQILRSLDIPKVAWRWPEPQQRLNNLDALRALGRAYEARCVYLREAASLPGLLRYLDESQLEIRQFDEERASDEQHVGYTSNAVVLLTYHKAKGLEWPVVVLGSLQREGKRDVFEVAPEATGAPFDAADPLGQRWIRCWPWPLGSQRNSLLRERAEASRVGRQLAKREARERVRLLYVGFTRARDHLILALPLNAQREPRAAWLNELRDGRGPLLQLPTAPEEESATAERAEVTIRTRTGAALRIGARCWRLKEKTSSPCAAKTESLTNERCSEVAGNGSSAADAGTGQAPANARERCWYAGTQEINTASGGLAASMRRREAGNHPRYVIRPSSAFEDGMEQPPARIVRVHRLEGRVPFARPKQATWDQVGTALHRFLAADVGGPASPERLELARSLLNQTQLDQTFAPEALLAASDAWRRFIDRRFPHATWYPEVPISAFIDAPDGQRNIRGTIDLWLETDRGGVLVDHKSYPGRAGNWVEQAQRHAAQLFTYRRALEAAGKQVHALFVHFTLGGGVVELASVE